MKTKKILFSLLFFVMALSLNAQDYAELYLIRDNSSLVSGNSHEIIVNYVSLEQLANDGYFYIQIPVGRNIIKTNTVYVNYSNSNQKNNFSFGSNNSFSGSSATTVQTSLGLTIIATAGEKYYVQIKEIPLPKLSLVKKDKNKAKIDKKIAEAKINLMGEFDLKESSPSMQSYQKPAQAEPEAEDPVETSGNEAAESPTEESNPKLRMLRSMQGK